MAGKICNGTGTEKPQIRQSVAYCEGRKAAVASGTKFSTGTTGVAGNNNGLTWTALSPGTGITVSLIDPGANDASLSVVVTGTYIEVNLATNGSGTITSTAAQVDAAVDANTDAAALVTPANTGASTGAAAVVAESVTLTGSSCDNQAGSVDAEDWADGFDSYNAGAGSALERDCCDDLAYSG